MKINLIYYPEGTEPTIFKSNFRSNDANQHAKIEKITIIRSIGTGNEHNFFSFGSAISLNDIKIAIVIIDKINV